MEVIMCLRAAVDLVLWIEVHNYLVKICLKMKMNIGVRYNVSVGILKKTTFEIKYNVNIASNVIGF